jgi:hypothetical protein
VVRETKEKRAFPTRGIMPKKTNHIPTLCQLKGYAVVYQNGKRISLGKWGTPATPIAYNRFVAEWGEKNNIPHQQQ